MTLEVEGKLDEIDVAGGVSALGQGSDPAHVRGELSGLDQIRVTAKDGDAVVKLS